MTLVKYMSASVSTASPVDRPASGIFGPNVSRIFGSDGFLEHGPRVNIVEGPEAFPPEMQALRFDKKGLELEVMGETLTIPKSEEAEPKTRTVGPSSLTRMGRRWRNSG